MYDNISDIQFASTLGIEEYMYVGRMYLLVLYYDTCDREFPFGTVIVEEIGKGNYEVRAEGNDDFHIYESENFTDIWKALERAEQWENKYFKDMWKK